MTTTEFTEKFARLESELAQEKGSFTLFALFMREDVPDRWDLIVSAPWIAEDQQAAVNFFVAEIKSRLGADALIQLSRIVVVDPEDAAVQKLNRAIRVEHGNVEIWDNQFFGLAVKHAQIITSQRPSLQAATMDGDG